MAYVKAAILTIFVLTGLLLGYMFFAFDSKYELKVAYDSFLRGENDKSARELASLQDSLPKGQMLLYQAYVARAQKKLDQSQKLLGEAEAAAKAHNQPELVMEIYLNQALNSYLMSNLQVLETVVKTLEQTASSQPWTVFFQALAAYQGSDFARALELWSIPGNRTYMSGWMKKAFEPIFSRLWMVERLAHCQIEEGKYLLARQTLEEESERANETERVELNYLIGLSYAKEAASKSPNTAAPYWKLALSYLGRIPFQTATYAKDRDTLSKEVQEVVTQLIDAKSYQDLPFYASMLQGWGSDDALNKIATLMVTHLNQAVSEGNWRRVEELASLLNRMLPDGDVRHNLQTRFQTLAFQALDQGNADELNRYWPIALSLSDHPDELTGELVKKIGEKVIALIPTDDEALSQTRPYLAMWSNVEKGREARLEYAKQLVSVDERLWLQPKQQAKAANLLNALLEVPQKEDIATLRQAVESSLARAYDQANANEESDRLPAILAAIEQHQFVGIQVKNPAQIQRHLASAQQALKQQDYQEAFDRAEWVLKLDPQDSDAKRLAGLSAYYLADYPSAVQLLSSSGQQDPIVAQALAVSRILTGDEVKGNQILAKLEATGPLDDDTLLRLGLGLAIEGRPEEAVTWLDKISQPGPEVSLGLAYADFLENHYEQLESRLADITPPYRALDAVAGLSIATWLEQNEVAKAEKALVKLLNQPKQPSTKGMSAPFQIFLQRKLGEYGRYYLAGKFFQEVKHNPAIAVKYLRLIEDPSPSMRVMRAQVEMDQKLYADAFADLLTVVRQDQDLHAQREAMPLLAQILVSQQRYLEATLWYQRYYAADPQSLKHRGDFAQALLKLQRYDLAFQQYLALKSGGEMTPQDTAGSIEALFHIGHWEEANELGERFLAEQPPMPLEYRLQVAKVMADMENYKSTWPLLKSLPSVAQLTDSQTEELMTFLISIGAFTQANTVASEKRDDLEKNVDGLLALASLNYNLSRFSDALTYARLARSLDGNNLNVYQAIGKYGKDTALLETVVRDLDKRSQADPENLSLYLTYVTVLTDLGQWARIATDRGAAAYSSDLTRANFKLEKLVTTYGGVPDIRILMGRTLALLNKPVEAIAAYRAALQLDPSNANAYLGLAREYRVQNDDKSAIRALYQAARFDPSNAESWLYLAEMYRQQDDLYEASHYYQNAIKHNPNNVRAYMALAQVMMDLRNPEDARTLLVYANGIAPKNATVLKMLLKVLHDPLLAATVDDEGQLAHERQVVYDALHALDAQGAERLLSELSRKEPRRSAETPSKAGATR